jgi:hypothetical protein
MVGATHLIPHWRRYSLQSSLQSSNLGYQIGNMDLHENAT